jgi:hypothetical protein
MTITNSFFNAAVPVPLVYIMPTKSVSGVAYAMAEFDAARHAVRQAFAQPNWDRYGALPIREETKNNALGVLNQLEVSTCAPEITPNPNGTVSFEWETNQGFGQLEIGRTRYSFCVQPHYGPPILDSGDAREIDHSLGYVLDALLYPKPSWPVTPSLR